MAAEHSSQQGRAPSPVVIPMAEPQHRPVNRDGEKQPPTPSAAPPPTENDAANAEDLFHDPPLEPTDDTPTVISRASRATVRPEEVLAAVLGGRRLAHFELLEPIGVGGMAAVILGRDTQLDRAVALKILPPEMAGDPENVRRFHQEARAAAKLDHENIARVFFCGEDQGLHFIAFEFVEGENLGAMLERRGRIPVPEAIGYVLQVATGLAHAAERGVVHRDIKPSNIIISAGGRAKLVDMGLARSLGPQMDGGLTQSGVTLGTFDYISPEQALEPREADVRSDMYSLGCTLYHMLTGQPSVPEGTAAKKLHHHQHIDPVDPRQLNPEIPDDVAALLARMMAKDPKARYQRPEQLIRHLVGLAQKLGVAADVANGVLFIDAPLLGPPKTRPLLLTSLAVLGVVALVFTLTWPSPSPTPNKPRDPVVADAKSAPVQPLHQVLKEGENVPLDAPDSRIGAYRFQDVKDLAEHLKKHPETKTLYLNEDLTLSGDEPLVLHDRNVTIEAEDPDPKRRPTIRLSGGPSPGKEPCCALTVKSGRVTIRGLRFELDTPRDPPNVAVAAIDHQGGRLKLEHCEFVQLNPRDVTQGNVSSIRISGPSTQADTAELILAGCYFMSGQNAVTLSRPATVRASDCAFGPHGAALFYLRNDRRFANGLETNLSVRNCSAILTRGAAFKLDEGVPCSLRVEHCIFSQPKVDASAQPGAALIEQAGESAEHVLYSGLHNGYHNLKAFWVEPSSQGPGKAVTDLSDFRQHPGVEDRKSTELTEYPWENPDPQQFLEDEPGRAFRLSTNMPSLRQVEDKTRLIGVENCAWGKTYQETVVALEEKKQSEPVPLSEEKPVILNNIAYRTLLQALDDAKTGDTLFIKKNGVFRVNPTLLEKAGVDITVKPYENYHPVLTMGQTTDRHAALFRLHDGQLKFEHLEFLLQPAHSDLKDLAIVAVMGNGQCSFKDCVVTHEASKEVQVPMTLIALPDNSDVMRMGSQPPAQQTPKILLENCFVRGSADLVTIRSGRPLELRIEDSLVVLSGSLLIVEGTSKEPATRMSHAEVALRHVTSYLTEHLICLRAGKDDGRNGRGLVSIQVKSVTNSLFVSALGKPLIHLDGIDTEDQMKRYFFWGGSEHNAYSGFERLLDQQPADGAMMAPPPYGTAQWRDFTQEQEGRFERVRFTNQPDASLAKATPADFNPKPEANWQGYGVNIEHLLERLPKLLEENAPRERSSSD